ncbi:rod shape-determining protein [Actinomadura hibisca]|uniref:rod shape-determining protein n=1 Tax=Actinomadura hibisca TaxID=68565 RepID=UPI00082B7230|nr:rod shape-determining protein [Actinomadura hibisca]
MRWRDFPCRSVAADLGSDTARLFVDGRGVVASEPSVLARCMWTGRFLGAGAEAQAKAGPGVELVRLIRDGVPAEQEGTEALLRTLLRRHLGKRYMAKPRIAITVPSTVTPVQYRAVEHIAYGAGARRVTVVPTPLAAARGAVERPNAAIADIGAEVTDVGVLGSDGLVSAYGVPTGGAALKRAIVTLVRREHELMAREEDVDAVRLASGGVVPGRDVNTGIPREATLTEEEVRRVLAGPLATIAETVRAGLTECPPDLAADLLRNGVTLTGGGARLPGLVELVRDATGMPVRIADEPEEAAVKGAARFLRSEDIGDLVPRAWPSGLFGGLASA